MTIKQKIKYNINKKIANFNKISIKIIGKVYNTI